MTVYTFPSGPLATNCYVIACLQTRKTAIIDPSPDSFKTVEAFLQREILDPAMILLTHSHWDHIADVHQFKSKYKVPVYVHEQDALNLEKPGADRLRFSLDIQPITPDHLVKDGEVIALGELNFTVIYTPGHSAGSVCYYCKEGNFLLSGDTLFHGSIGNISFPTSRPALMWDSLKKLAKLPASTVVYPGHGSRTTIGEEAWLDEAEHYFG